jgi:muramidase (phage lysozyme)
LSKHQYSPIDFFRQAPNALLNRYFHERNLLATLDIGVLRETDIEPIYQTWSELPAAERAKTEKDFSK